MIPHVFRTSALVAGLWLALSAHAEAPTLHWSLPLPAGPGWRIVDLREGRGIRHEEYIPRGQGIEDYRDRLLVQRVRQALATQPLETHSAESLSALLHLSARTLHRQLKEEGASLQALKNEVRRQRATELLLRTQRPIKQVAQATGFLNEKSFIRAFRLWTGHTPTEWRQRNSPPA